MRHLLNTLQEQALCQLEDEQQLIHSDRPFREVVIIDDMKYHRVDNELEAVIVEQEIIAEIQYDKTIDVYLKDTYEAGETCTSHMWSIDLDGQIQDI
tara:strand:- start:410 stop:700 length:291 start_codon:yes stop_codon:yes gene_type:complete